MAAPSAVSAVVPARNEAETVGLVVRTLLSSGRVSEVIVVDNASEDQTATIAGNAGARVVYCPVPGYGRAVKTGLAEASQRWVFKCDADMHSVTAVWVDILCEAVDDGTWLVKGNWASEHDPMPVTQLLVRPAFNRMYPDLLDVEVPLSGVWLIDTGRFELSAMDDSYALDLQLVRWTRRAGGDLKQVQIGEMQHADRGLTHEAHIAAEIMAYMVDQFSADPRERVLLVMAHSDDPAIWSGGLIARYANIGASVRVIVVCGDATRQQEAATLSNILSDVVVKPLGQPEFRDFTAGPARQAVRLEVEAFKPTCIVTHHLADPHPDHRNCSELTRAALLELGSPWFPRSILMAAPYFFETLSGDGFKPSVYVDISAEADIKREMLNRHVSQDIGYWARLSDLMDALNGLKSGVDRAEAYEPLAFYRSPAARAGI